MSLSARELTQTLWLIRHTSVKQQQQQHVSNNATQAGRNHRQKYPERTVSECQSTQQALQADAVRTGFVEEGEGAPRSYEWLGPDG